MTKSKHIICGVKGFEPQTTNLSQNKNIFWPVVCAELIENKLNSLDLTNINSPFKCIFTSKISVFFFMQEIHKKHPHFLSSAERIFFVGEKTNDYFYKNYINEQTQSLKEKLTRPSKNHEGLAAVIEEFSLHKIPHALYIFTSQDGATQTILKQFNLHKKKSIQCIEIYKIIPNPDSVFLTKQKEIYGSSFGLRTKNELLFVCHSGKILLQTVANLLNFFSCQTTKELPTNIRFSLIGKTTLNAAKQLDLMDRM